MEDQQGYTDTRMVGLGRIMLVVFGVMLCKSTASSLLVLRHPPMGGSVPGALKILKGLQRDKAWQPETRTRPLTFPSWQIISSLRSSFRSRTKLATQSTAKLCERYADNLRNFLWLLKRALLAITWLKMLDSLLGTIVRVSAKLDDLSEIGQSVSLAFHFYMNRAEWAADNVPQIIDYIKMVLVLLLLMTESIPLIAFFAGLKAYHMYNLPKEPTEEHQS